MRKAKMDRVSFNTKINNLSGITAIVAANLATPFLHNFAKRMGASPFHIGLLSSLPAAVSILALIPGAIVVQRFEHKKFIVGVLMALHRFFFLCFAIVPFVSKELQVPLIVFLVAIMNLPGSIFNSSWQAFIAEIFPESHRGLAVAQRNKYSTAFGLITTLAAGQLLTFIPKGPEETIKMYQVFFLIAFIISIVEVFLHFKLRESKGRKEQQIVKDNNSVSQKTIIVEFVKGLITKRKFLIFAASSLVFHFGWQMGWPLFSTYQLYYLHATESWQSIIGVSAGLASVLTYTRWSNYASKRGNGYSLVLTAAMMAVTPFLYAISNSFLQITLVNIIIGVSVAGFTLILFNTTLDVVPKDQRVMYIAVYNTAINISAMIAPIIGVWVYEHFNIYIALITTGVFRFLGAFAFFVRYRVDRKMDKATEITQQV